MERSEKFEAAFNQIHDLLCQYANEVNSHVSFTEALEKAKPYHKIIEHHYDLLKQCSKLRNAMVHRKIKQDFYIAEPHQEVVLELEYIAETLAEPPLAMDFASKPVIFFEKQTEITKVLSMIRKHNYSQFPIYHKQTCISLLTEGTILHWLASSVNEHTSLVNQTVNEVLPLEKEVNFAFIHEKATIYDAQAVFQSFMEQNIKLEAIIITETGDNSRLPSGIISSWDLVQLKLRTYRILNHT
ncbi:CBS domain-containing protein [Gracilibacillus ureilyticus]|uniref:CBS domain-containing protein n=1 Tax=Gracilibacillus ureilyticus TaxID=531814 RepID=A0A1H9LFI7_9BACI|nr:CBS domain-containing protein [Gracilibacillus ureilyticus]SER10251.1 CBS domain-containing protein [Gracilibacillus ureilyticus]